MSWPWEAWAGIIAGGLIIVAGALALFDAWGGDQ